MKILGRVLTLALCVTLMGTSCALAEEKRYTPEETEAREARLLRFAKEDWPDYEEEKEKSLYVSKVNYEEVRNAPQGNAWVEELSLYGLNPAQLEAILQTVPNVHYLDLENSPIEDVSPLLGRPSLESVTLHWSEHLPKQIVALAKLPSLSMLELFDVPADADLSLLAALPGLEKVALLPEEGTVCDLRPLKELPNLRSLSLHSWDAKTKWDALPDLPKLEELAVESLSFDPAQLIHTPALRKLEIHVFPNGASLAPLAGLTELTELHMRCYGAEYGDDLPTLMFPVLPTLPKLRTLRMWGEGDGSFSVIPTLPDLPALERFETNANIDSTQFRHTPSLRALEFAGGQEFSGLAALTELEELYVLRDLPGNLSPLYDIPALTKLQLEANGFYPISDLLEPLEALHEAAPGVEIVLYHCC